MPVRHASSATLASDGTSTQTRHLRGETGFVDENQLIRIEIKLPIKPEASTLQDLRPVLLQCVCGFFLNFHPRHPSKAPSALRLIFTCRQRNQTQPMLSIFTSFRVSSRLKHHVNEQLRTKV